MEILTKQFDLAGHYFELLKSLRSEIKIELIQKLIGSLNESRPTTEVSLQLLSDIYRPGETAEEIIADIKSARSSGREIEPL